ncbi:MAG: response regulator, partial [Cyanobacteria bacterium J06659_2]
MKTILVIEDEQAVRQTIKTTLEEQGFQVVDAADGLAGIEMLTTHHPDLVVCGIVIPECDGYAVLDALRHNDTTTGIPFIFLSSKSDKSDIRHGMNLGADDYLTKPFTDEDLLSAINARLDRQEAIAVPYQRDMKRAVDSLNQVAFYDPVTRLPNLIFLHQLLQEQLDRVQNQGISSDNWAIAVLNIHLSHQDWVARRNKLPLSEPLLRAVSARLKTTAEQNRAPFNGLVARVGSHQFALVLYNNDAARDLNELLNQLIADLEAPYEIEQYPVNIIAKIGGARFPQDGITSSTLLHRADIAVHHCVKSDDSVHQCYAQDMEAGYYRHKRLLGEIQSALDRGEFSLLYQPQLNTISERVTGAEALLRWQHPEFGQIAYEEFIT